MRKIFRIIILNFLAISGIYVYLRYKNRKKPLVLVYHDISSGNEDLTVGKTSLSIEAFQSQIIYLKKHYSFISLSDFINWKLYKKQLPPNPVLVTFDDGHKNTSPALLILQKENIQATLFLKTRSLGLISENYFEQIINRMRTSSLDTFSYRDIVFYKKDSLERIVYDYFRKMKYAEQVDFMKEMDKQLKNGDEIPSKDKEEKFLHFSEAECDDILLQGHTLQSHSVNHFVLSSLSDQQSYEELKDSKSFIEERWKRKVLAFAYPFGDSRYDYGVREMNYAEEIGYSIAFSGETLGDQFVDSSCNNYNIPRLGSVAVDLPYFKMLISGFRLFK